MNDKAKPKKYKDYHEYFLKGRNPIHNTETYGYGCSCSLCQPERKSTEPDPQEELENRMSNLTWDFYDISDELMSILIRKNMDYGPKSIMNTPGGPLSGLSVRLYDKVTRLSNLLQQGTEPQNESIRDTFIDIANYAIIGLMVVDGKWDK